MSEPVVSNAVVGQYERFSLYNSPYPAHDRGCAIDLYPGTGVPSPVSGTVLDTRSVDCPARSYAVDHDHLLLVDTGEYVARILHVETDLTEGSTVAVGDRLGSMVRSGFFGRWVDNHIHLEFRDPEQNLHRASGSVPLSVDVDVSPLRWDGIGTIVETGPTHVRLDTPRHTGSGFAALGSDDGVPLDGGVPHYTGGGRLDRDTGSEESAPLSLLGTEVGCAAGRNVEWGDVAVVVDGQRATGLSLFATQIQHGAKIVFHEGHDFAVGQRVTVGIEPTGDPIRLG
ncbi:MAG: hypothetical protein PPP58_01060 [Natronomonas sp.]